MGQRLMTNEEFDFDQDLLTIQCPKCSTIGDSRELILEDSDGEDVLDQLNHANSSDSRTGGATEFVCANCNLTF